MEHENDKIELIIPKVVHPEDYEVGVLIGRFQVPRLHKFHRELIETVCANHKKVIIFLGIPVVDNTIRNPLDFASRKAMIQEQFPHVTIIPLRDQRDNHVWSHLLDQKIAEPFGNRKSLLYGCRDSFIPFYYGRHKTVELAGNNDKISGSRIRHDVSLEVVNSEDFRKGVIYANYGRYPVIMPCADVVVYNGGDDTILLARKPNEKQYRFIGGHVDTTDKNYEQSAIRELHEEAGVNLEVSDPKYICSGKIADWRHAKETSEIFSTLFIVNRLWGRAEPNDDIEEVKWFKVDDVLDYEDYSKLIVPEHVEFFGNLVEYLKNMPDRCENTEVKPTKEIETQQ
jgi:bifunctional NMN adenylyltransferase/nudix hydrolase